MLRAETLPRSTPMITFEWSRESPSLSSPLMLTFAVSSLKYSSTSPRTAK